jgi:hypothetical protein
LAVQRYLLSTLKKVLSFDPSSGGFSTGAFAGVAALEGSLEFGAVLWGEALAASAGVAEASAMVEIKSGEVEQRMIERRSNTGPCGCI